MSRFCVPVQTVDANLLLVSPCLDRIDTFFFYFIYLLRNLVDTNVQTRKYVDDANRYVALKKLNK